MLFNRRYHPLFSRRLGGPVEAADSAEWVQFVRQSWFYSGQHTEAECRTRGRAALRAWGLTVPHGAIRGALS